MTPNGGDRPEAIRHARRTAPRAPCVAVVAAGLVSGACGPDPRASWPESPEVAVTSLVDLVGTYDASGLNWDRSSFTGMVRIDTVEGLDRARITWDIADDSWEGELRLLDDGSVQADFDGAWEGSVHYTHHADRSLRGDFTSADASGTGFEVLFPRGPDAPTSHPDSASDGPGAP